MVSRASRSSRSICHDGLPCDDGRGARRAAFVASCFRGALPFRPDRGLGPAELPPRSPPRSPPKKPVDLAAAAFVASCLRGAPPAPARGLGRAAAAAPVPDDSSSSSDDPELSPELSPELPPNPPLAPMRAAFVASCLRGAAPPRPARGLGPAAAAAVAGRRAAFEARTLRGCLPPVLTRGLGPAAALAGALPLIPVGCLVTTRLSCVVCVSPAPAVSLDRSGVASSLERSREEEREERRVQRRKKKTKLRNGSRSVAQAAAPGASQLNAGVDWAAWGRCAIRNEMCGVVCPRRLPSRPCTQPCIGRGTPVERCTFGADCRRRGCWRAHPDQEEVWRGLPSRREIAGLMERGQRLMRNGFTPTCYLKKRRKAEARVHFANGGTVAHM